MRTMNVCISEIVTNFASFHHEKKTIEAIEKVTGRRI